MHIHFVPNFNPWFASLAGVASVFGVVIILLALFLMRVHGLRSFGIKTLVILFGLSLFITPLALALPVHNSNQLNYAKNVKALKNGVKQTYGLHLSTKQAEDLIGEDSQAADGSPQIFMTVDGRKAYVSLNEEGGLWYLMSDSQELLETNN